MYRPFTHGPPNSTNVRIQIYTTKTVWRGLSTGWRFASADNGCGSAATLRQLRPARFRRYHPTGPSAILYLYLFFLVFFSAHPLRSDNDGTPLVSAHSNIQVYARVRPTRGKNRFIPVLHYSYVVRNTPNGRGFQTVRERFANMTTTSSNRSLARAAPEQ